MERCVRNHQAWRNYPQDNENKAVIISGRDGAETVVTNAKKLSLDAFIAVGGEDRLTVAAKLAKMDLRAVGVPKTVIDNEIVSTDVTFGFDSAVNVTINAID